MELSSWESDAGENKEKQRVADLLTSIEHCLFDGANVMRILCDITHMPLWYSLKCVVAVNNMDGPPKLWMHICASKLFPHSIRGVYRSDGLVPDRFWGKSWPKMDIMTGHWSGQWLYTRSITSNVFPKRNEFHPKISTILFSLECVDAYKHHSDLSEKSNGFHQPMLNCARPRNAQKSSKTCKRDAGDGHSRNISNLSYILRLERIKTFGALPICTEQTKPWRL